MKILATFDGTKFSESTLPLLERMAGLPEAEFLLLGISHEPAGKLMKGPRRTFIVGETLNAPLPDVIHTAEPRYAELKEQAIERKRSEMEDYLLQLASKLPPGSTVHVQAHVSESAAKLIIEHAREEQADVIVMATHSRQGISHLLFGSTTEEVVRSGVAPVLVVHPTSKP